MNLLKNPWVLGLGCAGFGLVAVLVIALVLAGRDPAPAGDPPASQGGLIVETGRDDDINLDPKHPLRCFVGGKLVGDLTLNDCARRNGVASGALDVGLDTTGALAAANGVDPRITPLPPPSAASGDAKAAAEEASAASSREAGCWRYADNQWERLPDDVSLRVCVQRLYEGQCESMGSPNYGRWGDRTIRLLDGRLEISGNNRDFRVLTDRIPGCSAGPG